MTISMQEAFGWVNIDERSHLSHVNRLSLYQLQDPNVPEAHKKAMIRELRISANSSKDIFEGLEVMMNVAKFEFDDDDYQAAKIDFAYCVDKYRPGSHRRGAASWMLGIVAWRVLDYQFAYNNWFQARQIFTDCAIGKMRVSASDMVKWYNKQLEMMRLDMACTAEEAVGWLNKFEQSHLTETAKQLSKQITSEIARKHFPQAYEIGNLLGGISLNRLDPMETAEVWVMIGLAAYQMGNPQQAIAYWKRGAASFTPWSHQWAATRWMTGVAQWMMPSENQRAMKSWTDALETFQDLKLQMDRAGDAERRDWYDGIGKTMKLAMEQKVSLGRPK